MIWGEGWVGGGGGCSSTENKREYIIVSKYQIVKGALPP